MITQLLCIVRRSDPVNEVNHISWMAVWSCTTYCVRIFISAIFNSKWVGQWMSIILKKNPLLCIEIIRTQTGRYVNVVWTSYSCNGRVMVVLVTREVATVVTGSWVRTAMTRRERCSDVLRSRRGRGKNFRNVGDARSSCIGVLVVLSACIPRSPRVPVASSPFELSP